MPQTVTNSLIIPAMLGIFPSFCTVPLFWFFMQNHSPRGLPLPQVILIT